MPPRLRHVLFPALVVIAVAMPAASHAQALTVAAASDLQAALPGIAERFERETGARLRLTFGSSGNFFAQIQNGAPFDVFLSADVAYPRQLAEQGFAEPATLTRYATGRLVLWTRLDTPVALQLGLEGLRAPSVRRIAVANPVHAPYGQAAVAALRRAGVYDAVRERLVLGENVSQAAQFAQSGNADAAIVALALAIAPAMKASGRHVEIPASLHPPIEQAGIVMTSSRAKSTARRFLAFLVRRDIAGHLHAGGFGAPVR